MLKPQTSYAQQLENSNEFTLSQNISSEEKVLPEDISRKIKEANEFTRL